MTPPFLICVPTRTQTGRRFPRPQTPFWTHPRKGRHEQPVYGVVRLVAAVLTDTEMTRLLDWLAASPARRELLDLALQLRDEPPDGRRG